MNLVVIDGPVDAVVDDVGVVVEAKVMQHLDGSRQRCDRVCLLRAHEWLWDHRYKWFRQLEPRITMDYYYYKLFTQI